MSQGPKLTDASLRDVRAGNFQAIVAGTSSTVAFTASSVQSSAFGAETTIIRVISTEDCFLKFGANPTAATTDMFLPSGAIGYFGVTAGEKVAAIRSSASGTLYITEGL
jgi:hypothetical protein